MKKVVIIGGGIAGLSAAITCAQRGMDVTLIEAGAYPAHKICGEFFSPESLPLLAQWNIQPRNLIHRYKLFATHGVLNFALPDPAGSMSRFYFDALLVDRARAQGVTVMIGTTVQAITQNTDGYELLLSSGQHLLAPSLVIGAGRVSKLLMQAPQQREEPRFVGIKAHFKSAGIAPDEVLFYAFPGAYLGVSTVEDGMVNIACLARKDFFDHYTTADAFMAHCATFWHARSLKQVLQAERLFPQWLTCVVPEFGIKKTPLLRNVFFVGDARGTIPPASGDGLAIGLLTGQMVAEYIYNNDAAGFDCDWKKRYSSTLWWGRRLHDVMLRPWLANMAVLACRRVPGLVQFLFDKTRRL